jgi:hypothetical protein
VFTRAARRRTVTGIAASTVSEACLLAPHGVAARGRVLPAHVGVCVCALDEVPCARLLLEFFGCLTCARGCAWLAAEYVDSAVRHVLMKQGVLGVKVQIMLPYDPEGKMGPKILMGDQVIIREPKE